MDGNQFGTKRIALNGILVAMAVITLFLADVVPTGRLSLYALGSFYISAVVVEFGIKNAWLFYIASSLLSLIILPDKIALIPYVIFFGIYGIVKYYIEKINKIPVEYVLKLIYFNICLTAAVLFVREFFASSIKVDFPWWAVIIALEIIFIIYDYVYSLFVQYYNNKLRDLVKFRR